jgi:hypothetical protein
MIYLGALCRVANAPERPGVRAHDVIDPAADCAAWQTMNVCQNPLFFVLS